MIVHPPDHLPVQLIRPEKVAQNLECSHKHPLPLSVRRIMFPFPNIHLPHVTANAEENGHRKVALQLNIQLAE